MGSYGAVKLVRDTTSDGLFAMKILTKKRVVESKLEKQLRREVLTHLKAYHPHVLRMHYYFEDSSHVYCLLDYADRGHLYSFLREHSNGLPEMKAAGLFSQIVCGVQYLHLNNIVHRDLKPENILLFGSSLSVKIGDLGWCAELTPERPTLTTFCGTRDYIAPEMLLNQPYDQQVDLWALGVILYEMLMSKPPFPGTSRSELAENVCYLSRPILEMDGLSRGPQDIIRGLLIREPCDRLPLDELLQHPWVDMLADAPDGGQKCSTPQGAAKLGGDGAFDFDESTDEPDHSYIRSSQSPGTVASDERSFSERPQELATESTTAADEMATLPAKGPASGMRSSEAHAISTSEAGDAVVFLDEVDRALSFEGHTSLQVCQVRRRSRRDLGKNANMPSNEEDPPGLSATAGSRTSTGGAPLARTDVQDAPVRWNCMFPGARSKPKEREQLPWYYSPRHISPSPPADFSHSPFAEGRAAPNPEGEACRDFPRMPAGAATERPAKRRDDTSRGGVRSDAFPEGALGVDPPPQEDASSASYWWSLLGFASAPPAESAATRPLRTKRVGTR